ncbi:trypsin [Corynebacterium sp. H78]|uniref:trypsin n=1 Tax=Corynebacterium sp. H78 TaxID=3133417 RepID=UPI0030A0BCA4
MRVSEFSSIGRKTSLLLASCAIALTAAVGFAPAAVADPNPAPSDTQNQDTMYPHPVRDDLVSKIMALSPGNVHNRIAGSFFDSPTAPPAATELANQGRVLVGPGTPLLVGYGEAEQVCTVTVTGRDNQDRLVGITAGHCGRPGTAVRSMDAIEVGPFGTIERVNDELDYSVIVFDDRAELTADYNNARISQTGPLPAPGSELCKLGIATGKTCGPAWTSIDVANPKPANIEAQVCASQGDSGAPVFQGETLVGMIRGARLQPACVTPLQGALFAPTLVTSIDAIFADINANPGAGQGLRITT